MSPNLFNYHFQWRKYTALTNTLCSFSLPFCFSHSLSILLSLLSYTQHIFVCTFETFIFFCYHRFNAEPNLPLVKCYLLILTHPFVSIEVNSFRIFCAIHLYQWISQSGFSLSYINPISLFTKLYHSLCSQWHSTSLY